MSYGASFRYAVRRISTSTTPLPVIYADRGVAVLNKPSGLVSQGSLQENDALNRVLSDIKRTYDYSHDLMPVHRLDKMTTGCLLLATTPHMSRELSRQFQQGLIEKTYLAVVHGVPSKSGTIRKALALRNGRVSVSDKGKECITSWELLGHSGRRALLRIKLITGHKHQIRVHLSRVLGVPIVGDVLYGTPSDASATHMLLHSSYVSMIRFRPDGPHKRFQLGIRSSPPPEFLDACSSFGLQVPEQDATGCVIINGVQMGQGDVLPLGGRWVGLEA